MIHLTLPPGYDNMKAPFYLAMEEWAAEHLPQGQEGFFIWQLDPTVVFGRNQRIEKEVDIEYCRNNGINFFRRKSGGGCIYADRNNVMFSYIASNADDVQTMFARYTGRVAEFLRSLGLNASANTRNDVLIGDKKVSGWAFLKLARRSVIHGTMLYDTDRETMVHAITPSKSKLESKGVKSVGARVTTIRAELPSLSLEEFKNAAVNSLTDTELALTPEQVASIKELSKPYYESRWVFGPRRESPLKREIHIPGVGEFEADLWVEPASNRLIDIDLRGDYFPTGDIDALLLDKLRGREFSPWAIGDALLPQDTAAAIAGLQPQHILNLLFQ